MQTDTKKYIYQNLFKPDFHARQNLRLIETATHCSHLARKQKRHMSHTERT